MNYKINIIRYLNYIWTTKHNWKPVSKYCYLIWSLYDCPEGQCECALYTDNTDPQPYCCSCFDKKVAPDGPTCQCPKCCVAYCYSTYTAHCCYCDEHSNSFTTPTTTTTTTTTTTPKPPPPPSPPACFPSAAKVHLQNGKSVRMSELQKGHHVQTGINNSIQDRIWDNMRQ